MKKRVISIMFAAVLVLMLLPTTAFAETVISDVSIYYNYMCNELIETPEVYGDYTIVSVKICEAGNIDVDLIGKSETLQNGKNYILTVTLKPNDGYTFADTPRFYVNGFTLTPESVTNTNDSLSFKLSFKPHYGIDIQEVHGGRAYKSVWDAAPGETVKITYDEWPEGCVHYKSTLVKCGEEPVAVNEDLEFVMPEGYVFVTVTFERSHHYVQFFRNGHGETPEVQLVPVDNPYVTLPDDPECPGYTFGGWYWDNQCETKFDATVPLEEDVDPVLFAKWTEESGIVKYPVLIGGNQLNDQYPKVNGSLDVFGDGTVLYTPAADGKNAQLALNHAVIEHGDKNSSNNYAIEAMEDLDIVLTGTNRLGTVQTDLEAENKFSIYYGILGQDSESKLCDINLYGSGSLEIYDRNRGIYAGNILIDIEGTLRIREYGDEMAACCLKVEGGKIVLENGTLDLESLYSNAVYGAMTINGGSLEAYAHNASTLGEDPELFAFRNVPVISESCTVEGGDSKDTATEIDVSKTVSSKYVKIVPHVSPSYTIIEGDDSTWSEDSEDGLAMTSDAPFDKFEGVEVDDETVDPANYTAESGSTKVTLKPAYLKTLEVGEHTFKIISSDGVASSTFTIEEEWKKEEEPPKSPDPEEEPPETGDSNPLGLLMMLLVLSACVICSTVAVKRNK